MNNIITVPTGNIGIIEASKGKLEFVSLRDYGKHKNIKADFLGYTKEINQVPHNDLMPYTKKWVITISSQYGCSMKCKFCDVPVVGKGINATTQDLLDQIMAALSINPEVKRTDRLNIHYARMGEPTFNNAILDLTPQLKRKVKERIDANTIHPVISTMLPKSNKNLVSFIHEWCRIKNLIYKGEAGLQFSINSTDDLQRNDMFQGCSLSLREISEIGRSLPEPIGRKYTLNFALADNFIIDAKELKVLFNPRKFMVKLTPIHQNTACNKNSIITSNGYFDYSPYREIEHKLINEGFDVLVFIPSIEEDTSRITCGNAILSDKSNFNV